MKKFEYIKHILSICNKHYIKSLIIYTGVQKKWHLCTKKRHPLQKNDTPIEKVTHII